MIGDHHEVTVGPVAHGGHFVARLEGRVIFVRHALPGERVRIRITEESKRFWRADAVEVLESSPLRVEPPCKYAGVCGGCDFQHIGLAGQRELLSDVIREQLHQLAGLEWDGAVESVSDSGLDWRTRVTFAVDEEGVPGLRKHRSHDIVPIDECLIAHPDIPQVLGNRWPAQTVEAITSSSGQSLVVVDKPRGKLPKISAGGVMTGAGKQLRGKASVTETVREHDFRVSGSGFWQVHPEAAQTLVDAVLEGAQIRPGNAVVDLYAGAGLFTAFLADATGVDGSVVSVESDIGAGRDARRNLHAFESVKLVNATVDEALASGACGAATDVVILDPPRSGAGKSVGLIGALGAARIVYVACDPAALARDLASFAEIGYRLESLRAFDLFPMTHHVECVAVLAAEPVSRDP